MRVYTTAIFVFLMIANSMAQQEVVDSLTAVIKSKPHDTLVVQTYNTLAKMHTRTDPDKGIAYADSAIYFGKKIDFKLEIGKSLMHKGIASRYKEDLDAAVAYNYEALEIFEELDNKRLIGGCHINIGIIFENMGDVEKSREHYLIARDIMIAEQDIYGGAHVSQNLGILMAIDSQYREAIPYFEDAMRLFKQINDQVSVARLMGNFGLLYSKLGDYDKAISSNQEGFEIFDSLNDQYGKATTLLNMGEIYYEKGDYGLSVKVLNEGYSYSRAFPYPDLNQQIQRALSMAYEKRGDYKNALVAYKSFQKYQDTIDSQVNERILADMESKYENDRIKNELELVSKNEELNQLKIEQQDQQIESDKNQKYALYVGLFLVLLVAGISIYSFVQKKKDNQIISQQKKEVEEKHSEITDSINYAEKIQTAMLGNQDVWNKIGAERFIYFKPKEHVSGDFYWCSVATKTNEYAWVAADCTGHGVPGAMMSMLGVSVLNETFREIDRIDTAEVLSVLRSKIIQSLKNKNQDNQRRDGMDMALCVYNPDTKILSYAGANNPLWIISKRENLGIETKHVFDEQRQLYLHEIKGSKQPVGLYTGDLKDYQSHQLKVEKDEIIYTFSDGFADQFGGEKGKKLKYANFKKLLLSISSESAENQKSKLENHFVEWMGDFEQVDDVLVVGVKMS